MNQSERTYYKIMLLFAINNVDAANNPAFRPHFLQNCTYLFTSTTSIIVIEQLTISLNLGTLFLTAF